MRALYSPTWAATVKVREFTKWFFGEAITVKPPSLFSDLSELHFRLFPTTQSAFEVDAQGILKTKRSTIEPKEYHLIGEFPVDQQPAPSAVHVQNGATNLSDSASLSIQVQAADSTGPKISAHSCGRLSVPENRALPALTRVLTERGSGRLSFSIVGGSGGALFAINETSGLVSAQPLDREAAAEHILVVGVADDHQPQRVDVCTISVTVLDENDNAPQFAEDAAVALQLDDSVKLGAMLGRVSARDPDLGANGRVVYKLVADPSGMLDVDWESGDVLFAR